MCFVLYAGTEQQLPRMEWNKDAPDLCVESLIDRDLPVRAYFDKPEVQYIGSTAGCGCDFPHVSLYKGQWPVFECDESDPEREAKVHYNRKALVTLLQESGEKSVELYGVWDGDVAEPPKLMEDISLQRILDPDFRFKEQGFYRVNIINDPDNAPDCR